MAKKKRAALKRRQPSRTRTAASKARKALAAAGVVITAAIPPLKAGEAYAGILIKDGKPMHHLVLLPGEAKSVTWADAKAFAEKAGGELPTRKEQALLFANAAEHFGKEWCWSGETHEKYPEYAWLQFFFSGNQLTWHKDFKGRARAVRRVPI